ncbi:hypothetical protein BDF19DRAFT_148566 [Syncephalis fuscata]|nr:hypothetical protein BDF19DRAFT_148566 [Syncephalis fuscata]
MSDHDELLDEYSEEEVDDVLDSEEEEDDELDDDHHRRPKKRNRNTFFLDEAEVDDDDEEEEEEEEFGEGGFLNEDLPDDEEIGDKGATRHQQLDRRRIRDEEINAEELAAQLRERYSRDDYASGGRRGNIEHVTERMKLPDVKGPKLWMVKCKPGKEWDVIVHLIKKCLTGRFDVLSAFTRDSLKGYVYIEARQPASAQKCLENVPFAYASTFSLVPVGQMVDVLKVTKKDTVLKPRSWVRIRRGKFLNDLAQVLEVSESGDTVIVKLIPRFHLKDEQALWMIQQNERLNHVHHNVYLILKIDSKLLLINMTPFNTIITIDNNNSNLEGMKDILPGRGNTFTNGTDLFRDGFLEKRVKLSALITDDVNATLEEISKFASNEQDDEDGALSLSSLAEPLLKTQADPSQFHPGDHVTITQGVLKNAHGVIDRVIGSAADIIVYAGNGVRKNTSLPIEALRKRFQQGDHVKVINGRYKDETGLIVKVADSIVTVISDTTMKEISVFSKDLREAGDVTVAQTVVSPFDLHDCVEFLDNQHVGIVVRVDREYLTLLREDGQVGLVKPHQVAKQKRDLRRAVAADADGNVIRVGDKVKEVDSSSREGVILYIHRGSVFIRSREVTENSGVFMVRGQQVRSMANTGARQAMANDKFARPAPPIARVNGRYNQRNDRLVGQTVVITQGKDKGLLGIVKECTNTGARVELHSNARIVAIDKTKLHVKTSTGGTIPAVEFSPNMPGTSVAPTYTSSITAGGANGRPASGYSSAGAQTPFISAGGRTPNPYASGGGGNRTPAWDAGNRTPAWNPGNRTPAWNAGNQTPAWSGGGGNSTTSDSWGSSSNTTTKSSTDNWGSSRGGSAADGWSSNTSTSNTNDGWGSTVGTPMNSDQWGDANTTTTAAATAAAATTTSSASASATNRGWESSSIFPNTPGPMTPAPATPSSMAQTPRFPSTPGPHTPSTQATNANAGGQSNGSGADGSGRHGGDYGSGDATRETDNDIYHTAWPLEGICVTIIPKHRVNGQPWQNGNENEEAVVTQVHANGNCTIQLTASQQVIPQVPRDYLAPVAPEKKDMVAFLIGKDRGRIGELVGVDNMDGIVKGLDAQEFNFCLLAKLAKYSGTT